MYTLVVNDVAALNEFVPAWENLISRVLEPNPFYEPWMLIPAARAYGVDKQLRFVLILSRDPAKHTKDPIILHAIFPLELNADYNGLGKRLPIKSLSLWRYPRAYLCTPLISARDARECLTQFFEWLDEGSHGCALMEFGHANGDGPFGRLLIDQFYKKVRLTYTTDCYTRALFRPASDDQEYLRLTVSPKHRRNFRTQEKKLSQEGRVGYAILSSANDVAEWTRRFLELEGSGWKGKERSAFICSEADQIFFGEIVSEAFRRGQLMMLGLYLDEEPIAYKCNLIAVPGSFAFRIAYAEKYSKYSPGLLLELENIRQLHARPEIRWMDSCADPDNFMINHLWFHRRTIPTIVVGTGRRPGDLVVAAMPMLRWLNRRLRNFSGKTQAS